MELYPRYIEGVAITFTIIAAVIATTERTRFKYLSGKEF